jgi:hypothetical protein
MMSDPLIAALLGQAPTALAEDVSLATPLKASRIFGREAVSAALGTYRDVLATPEATARLKGYELDGVVFSASVDGETAEIVALADYDAAGLITAIDVYGRPWPYMALLRDPIAKVDPDLADPSLGAGLYVPERPRPAPVDHPHIPPLARDVTLYSPILSGEPSGKALIERILEAADQSYRDLKVRAVLDVEGRSAFAIVIDEFVDDHVMQLVEIFALNTEGEVNEIRVFSRPWLVTAHFRKRMHALLTDVLGPELWQGPDLRVLLSE